MRGPVGFTTYSIAGLWGSRRMIRCGIRRPSPRTVSVCSRAEVFEKLMTKLLSHPKVKQLL